MVQAAVAVSIAGDRSGSRVGANGRHDLLTLLRHDRSALGDHRSLNGNRSVLACVAVEAFASAVGEVLTHGPGAIGLVLPSIAAFNTRIPPCAFLDEADIGATGRPAAHGRIGRPDHPQLVATGDADRSSQVEVDPSVLVARHVDGDGAHCSAFHRLVTTLVDRAGVVATNSAVLRVGEQGDLRHVEAGIAAQHADRILIGPT